MSLRINQNIAAMNAYRNLSVTDGQMSKSLEKLSSGFRINRAADDAAGLSISEGLRSQIGGLKVAVRNSQDAINVVQTADGALTETHAILQRMRDLAVQSANGGSQDANAQDAANTEFGQLKQEVDRIANTTSFGGQKLLDANYNGTFQVGANNTTDDRIDVDLTSAGLASSTSYAAGTAVAATASTDTIDLTSQAGTLGSALNGKTVQFTDGTNTSTSVTFGATQFTDGTSTVADVASALSGMGANFSASSSGNSLVITSTATGAGAKVVAAAGDNTGLAGVSVAGSDATTTGQKGINAFDSAGLGLSSATVGTTAGAQSAIDTIDNAIKGISTARANLGAYQNRFEHTVNNLNVAVQNLSASESQIRDTDMASEMTNFTRAQILSQAGTAMLAQANQVPQGVLRLLQ